MCPSFNLFSGNLRREEAEEVEREVEEDDGAEGGRGQDQGRADPAAVEGERREDRQQIQARFTI